MTDKRMTDEQLIEALDLRANVLEAQIPGGFLKNMSPEMRARSEEITRVYLGFNRAIVAELKARGGEFVYKGIAVKLTGDGLNFVVVSPERYYGHQVSFYAATRENPWPRLSTL